MAAGGVTPGWWSDRGIQRLLRLWSASGLPSYDQAMSEEPVERESKTEIKAGLTANSWFPLSLSWGRTVTKRWRERAEQLGQDVATAADLSLDELAKRLDRDEALGDLIASATERAVRTTDVPYRESVARLIAAGLRDDARIDAVTYYTSIIVRLEPVHLRVLRAVAQHEGPPVSSDSDDHPPRAVDVGALPDLGMPQAVAYSAAERLSSLGLLVKMENHGGLVSWGEETSLTTEAGRELLGLCAAIGAEPETVANGRTD